MLQDGYSRIHVWRNSQKHSYSSLGINREAVRHHLFYPPYYYYAFSMIIPIMLKTGAHLLSPLHWALAALLHSQQPLAQHSWCWGQVR